MTARAGATPSDAMGLALGGADAAAAQHYRDGVDRYLHAWPGAAAALEAAVQLQPGFALARAALALLQAASGQAAEGRASIARAAADVQRQGGERERSHVALLACVIEGRPAEALNALPAHAERWPRDALALSVALGAFGLFAFSGRADHDAVRRDFVASLVPHYPAGHSWLLTQRAWTHVECGDLEQGAAHLAHAFALRRDNGNAAHVQMHLHFEAGSPGEALRFIDDWIDGYPDDAMLWGHLHWHALLAHLALDDEPAAVRRLMHRVVPHLAAAWPLVGLSDIASALWRLALRGCHDLPWQAGYDFAARRYAGGGNPFVELHLAMLAAAQRDAAALAQIGSRLQRLASRGNAAAPVVSSWVQMLQAHAQGDLPAAVAHLQTCLAEAPRIGGSHAQRTVLERTYEHLLSRLPAPRTSAPPGAA